MILCRSLFSSVANKKLKRVESMWLCLIEEFDLSRVFERGFEMQFALE